MLVCAHLYVRSLMLKRVYDKKERKTMFTVNDMRTVVRKDAASKITRENFDKCYLHRYNEISIHSLSFSVEIVPQK